MKYVLLSFLFVIGIGLQAYSATCDGVPFVGPSIQGGVNPWPWGNETSFPWSGIQGIWQLTDSKCEYHFSFKVEKPSSSKERFIKISQYDPLQCRIIATGIGYQYKKVVRAVMASDQGPFELTIHAFRISNAKEKFSNSESDVTEPTLVMRMKPFDETGNQVGSNKFTAFKIERLERSPNIICQ